MRPDDSSLRAVVIGTGVLVLGADLLYALSVAAQWRAFGNVEASPSKIPEDSTGYVLTGVAVELLGIVRWLAVTALMLVLVLWAGWQVKSLCYRRRSLWCLGVPLAIALDVAIRVNFWNQDQPTDATFVWFLVGVCVSVAAIVVLIAGAHGPSRHASRRQSGRSVPA